MGILLVLHTAVSQAVVWRPPVVGWHVPSARCPSSLFLLKDVLPLVEVGGTFAVVVSS